MKKDMISKENCQEQHKICLLKETVTAHQGMSND